MTTYSDVKAELPNPITTNKWYKVDKYHVEAMFPNRGNMRVRKWVRIFGDSFGWTVYRYTNKGDLVHVGYSMHD